MSLRSAMLTWRGGALSPPRLLLLVLFVAAPTVGDVGSCGQELAELDAAKFFVQKAFIDCQRCLDCNLTTATCQFACAPAEPISEFPAGCFPLVHDGEVCLNALSAASCAAYAEYVDDVAPSAPTECNFCPPQADAGVQP